MKVQKSRFIIYFQEDKRGDIKIHLNQASERKATTPEAKIKLSYNKMFGTVTK